MSWWRKLFGRRKHQPIQNATFPCEIEIVPGKLRCDIRRNSIEARDGNVECWTYVTHGLQSQGHKELVLHLKIDPQEDPTTVPRDPLLFFEQVYQYALRGLVVEVGGYTGLQKPSFLSHIGIAYVTEGPHQSVKVPANALIMLLLHQEELDMVINQGATRLMALMAKETRFFPCPIWADRQRKPTAVKAVMDESVLNNLPVAKVSGIWGKMKGQDICLRLTPDSGDKLLKSIEQLPPDMTFALLTDLDTTATGSLVWDPRDDPPTSAVGPDGADAAHLSGCFLVFAADRDGNQELEEDAFRVVEDGFGLVLTNASWHTLVEALQEKQELYLPGGEDDWSLKVEWTE